MLDYIIDKLVSFESVILGAVCFIITFVFNYRVGLSALSISFFTLPLAGEGSAVRVITSLGSGTELSLAGPYLRSL